MLKRACWALEQFAYQKSKVWLKLAMTHDELNAMDGPFVLLTEEEHAALEARLARATERLKKATNALCSCAAQPAKPQVPAEVIARAREAAALDHECMTADRMMRACDAKQSALRDLLACVEAQDARAPVPPGLIRAVTEIANSELGEGESASQWLVSVRETAKLLLSHLRPAPDERLTEAEWSEKLYEAARDAERAWNMIVTLAPFGTTCHRWSVRPGQGPIHIWDTPLQAYREVVAAAPDPAPDFSAMSPDDLRAWLDERGRRSTWNSDEFGWSARLTRYADNGEIALCTVDHPDEPVALRALCEKVTAEEGS